MKRHPLHRGCGLKSNISIANLRASRSPSSQRVWIEIFKWANMLDKPIVTLFTEGVDWNRGRNTRYLAKIRSPSSQRVWIEMRFENFKVRVLNVTLFTEGVDWNRLLSVLPVCLLLSPSSQRVWIEIIFRVDRTRRISVTLFTEGVDWNKKIRLGSHRTKGHPLHRGCGLKYIFNNNEKGKGHPLHRGCGLKWFFEICGKWNKKSPSSQRVWIEIQNTSNTTGALRVTLFTEGVNWNYLLHFLI